MEIYQSQEQGLASGQVEPISVSDAKAWSIIETSLDDAIITSIISSARQAIEAYISRDIVSKTYKFTTDGYCYESERYIVHMPVPTSTENITSIADDNGAITNYSVIGADGVLLKLDEAFTGLLSVDFDSMAIVSPSELELAKTAVKMLIEQIYDNRGNLEGDSDIMILDDNIKKLVRPLKQIHRWI